MIKRTQLWSRGGPLIAVLGVTLALVLAGCGSSSSSSSAGASSSAAPAAASGTTTNTVKLAKTKFVLHAGLAFGAFHRWIYKPVKAGYLAHPLNHKLALVKGGVAAAFVLH